MIFPFSFTAVQSCLKKSTPEGDFISIIILQNRVTILSNAPKKCFTILFIVILTSLPCYYFTEIQCQTAHPENRLLIEQNPCTHLSNRWNKIYCSPFLPGPPESQCSRWCDIFASCFPKRVFVRQQCLDNFRYSRKFKIFGNIGSENSSRLLKGKSAMRNIDVIQCWTFWKGEFPWFIVKASQEGKKANSSL